MLPPIKKIKLKYWRRRKLYCTLCSVGVFPEWYFAFFYDFQSFFIFIFKRKSWSELYGCL